MGLLTEDEAREKWCPFVRGVTGEVEAEGRTRHSGAQPAYNRVIGEEQTAWPAAVCCIGSKCMSWRSVSPVLSDETKALIATYRRDGSDQVKAVKAIRADTGVDLKVAVDVLRAEMALPKRGYCGLAGRPE